MPTAPSLRTSETYAAPRRLTRSLSSMGGAEIVDSIHDDIDISCLRVVEEDTDHHPLGGDSTKRGSVLQAQSALDDDDVCPGAPWVMGDCCHQTFQLDTLLSALHPSSSR